MNKILNKKVSSIFAILAIFLSASGFSFLPFYMNTKTSHMVVPRSSCSAFLLKDGRVVVIGQSKGKYDGEDTSMTVEVYNPKTNKFSLLGNLNQWRSRNSYTTTLLNNGKILITGGQGPKGIYDSSAEIFDSNTGKSEYTGDMNIPRSEHSATLLQNGKVLITGGFTSKGDIRFPKNRIVCDPDFSESETCDQKYLKAEIYDPATGKFSLAGKMVYPRNRHASKLLNDGNVLIAGGGITFLKSHDGYTSKAEIYLTDKNKFIPINNMNVNRGFLKLLKLNDGKVLVYDGANDSKYLKNVEIYDPKNHLFKLYEGMNDKRFGYTALVLPNEKVLIAGGTTGVGQQTRALKSMEIFDPTTGEFKVIGNMKEARSGLKSVLLKDGNILIVGGTKSRLVEIYRINGKGVE
jgi:hypothetical protein